MRTDSWWQIINIRNNLPFVTQCQITSSVLMSLAPDGGVAHLSHLHTETMVLGVSALGGGGIAPSHSALGGPGFHHHHLFSEAREMTPPDFTSGWCPWSKAVSGCPLSLCLRLLTALLFTDASQACLYFLFSSFNCSQ